MPDEIIGLSREAYNNLNRFMAAANDRDLTGRPGRSRFPSQFIEEWLGVVYIPPSGDYEDERYYVRRAAVTPTSETARMSYSALAETDSQYLQITATHLSESIGNAQTETTATSHLIADGTPVIVKVLADGQGNRHYFFNAAWPNPGTTELTALAWYEKRPFLDTTEECEEDTSAHTDVQQTWTAQQSFGDLGGGAGWTFDNDTDRAAQRTELGLGDASTASIGSGTGQVAAGDDARLNIGTLTVTTSIDDPGTDDKLPTEKAVRDLYNTMGSGAAATWGSITGTLADQTDLINILNAKVPYTGATATVDLGTHSLALTGNIASATAPASNVFASQINGTALGDAAYKNTGTNTGDVADGGSQAAHIAATGTNHGQVFGSSQTAGLAKSNPAGAISADANGMFSFNLAGVSEETTIADSNFLTFTDATGTATYKIGFDNFKTCLPGTTATAADPWANLTLLTATSGVQLGTSVAAIVSCTTGVIEVYSIEAVNTDTSSRSLTFYFAGTNDANIFYPPLSISSGAKRVNSEKTSPIFVLESGQSLYGKATAASKINVVVQGIPKASSSFTMLTSVGLQLGTAAAAIIAAGTQVAEIHSINFADINASSAATVTNYAFATQTANIHSHPSIPASGCVRYVGDCPTILSSSGNFYSLASIANIINVMAVGKRRAS